MVDTGQIRISPETLSLIAEIYEFKGVWRAFGTLAPERLSALRRVATIEGIGSSKHIEGGQLSDRDVKRLFANLEVQSSTDHCVSAGRGDARSHSFLRRNHWHASAWKVMGNLQESHSA